MVTHGGGSTAIGGGMLVGWIFRAIAMAVALVVGTLVVLQARPGGALPPWLLHVEAHLARAAAPAETHVIGPVVDELAMRQVIVEVGPHWPALAVMFFLFFASLSRIAPPAGWAAQAAMWAWSAVCALVAGAVAGTFVPGEARLLWWALGGVALWNLGAQLVVTRFSLSSFAALGLFGLFAAMAFAVIPGTLHPVPDAPLPGLAGTAVVASAFALGLMGLATFGDDRQQGAAAWLNDRFTREGMTMLSVIAAIALAQAGLA